MHPVVNPARSRGASLAIPAVLLMVGLAACSTPEMPKATTDSGMSGSSTGAMGSSGSSGAMPSTSAPPRAMAPLQAKSGSLVGGTIFFSEQPGGVRVVARVTGLKPNQEHGFHVHEKGDCSAPDAMSAGGHFNPTAQPHGPQATAHHGGDMPSLKADAVGNAEATFTIAGVSVAGASDGVIGKSVVVHAQPDDYKTQPTGNSGGRVACGVIAAVQGT